MPPCPCTSGRELADCCQPVLDDPAAATTAEALMRSRYSAFALSNMEHLIATTAPEKHETIDRDASRRWAESRRWQGLEIVRTEAGGPEDDRGVVEFIANYVTADGERHRYHERSTFRRDDGRWLFVDGDVPKPETIVNDGPKIGRNDPCPCGSGKKFKKCCG